MTETNKKTPWRRWSYAVAVLTAAAMIAAPALVSAQSSSHGEDQMFTSLPLCQIIDSRNWDASQFGGDAKPQPDTTYTFDIRGASQSFEDQGGSSSGCGVPASADAVVINILAVSPDGGGNMKAFPEDQAHTDVSGTVINYQSYDPNVNLNNAVTVLMDASTDDGDINIRPQINATHIIGTVMGYYQNTTDGFYTKAESNDRYAPHPELAEASGSTIVPADSNDTLVGSVEITVPDRCSLLDETWTFLIHATGYLQNGTDGSDSIIWLEDSDSSGNDIWVNDPDSGRHSLAVHDRFLEADSGTKTFELHADNFTGSDVSVTWQLTAEAKNWTCSLTLSSESSDETHPTDKRSS